MSIHHRHLSTSIAISVTLVAAILFALLVWFRPWDTPSRAFGIMLDAVKDMRQYAVHTTGDAVVKGPAESVGVTYRLDGVASPRKDSLADYSMTLNGSGTFRDAKNERSTFTGAVDVRIIAGRVFIRLVDFQLSNDLKPRFQDYLSVYRGVWYRLPQDALGRAARGDSATLTDFARLMGLIQPVSRSTTQVTAMLDPTLLQEFITLYVHARGILPPPAATHTTTPGESSTGGEVVWNLTDAGVPQKIDGKLSSLTDALGGSLLTATFSTTVTPNAQLALPVAPERPVDYDLRQVLQ